jgi:hypothetical protein
MDNTFIWSWTNKHVDDDDKNLEQIYQLKRSKYQSHGNHHSATAAMTTTTTTINTTTHHTTKKELTMQWLHLFENSEETNLIKTIDPTTATTSYAGGVPFIQCHFIPISIEEKYFTSAFELPTLFY